MLSAIALDHLQNPRHRGPLDDARYGVAGTPGDGPYVEMWVKLEDRRALDAAFVSHGCPSSMAAGSLMCSLLVRMPATDPLAEMSAQDLLTLLGGLPEGKEFCADLAVRAAKSAVFGTP